MTIDNFFTWEMLATFAGCMAATIILTEFVKKFLKMVDPQIISFVFAFVILAVGQIVTGVFSWNDILLDAVNAVAISLASNGGFDAIKAVFGSKKAEAEAAGTLMLDANEPGNSYISFNDTPDKLENGEEVKLVVKHI